MSHGTELTRHHALPRRFAGYTAMDWFKFYGFFAGMIFLLCYTYTRYLALFEEVEKQGPGFQIFVVLFAGIPVLMVAIALLGFNWWAGAALTRYSKWQLAQPRLWQGFWFIVLSFYTFVLIDPLDKIHPAMSRLGLAPAPNIKLLFDGKFEMFQFQWGYFLLWALFWFLLAVLHVSYLADFWKELFFNINRTHRYGASVLTGFRESMAVYVSPPATSYEIGSGTAPWAAQLEELREGRPSPLGAPYVNPALPGGRLSLKQAQQVIAADASGAIVAGPGGDGTLFVDLGRWDFSPALAQLQDDAGRPLLLFESELPTALQRADLLLPLSRQPHERAGGGGL
ncbi:hypothetical protein IT575_09860 [bacterium]|nr:hypothetical protein [bacterium]